MTKNIMIVGVGGQGTLLASKMLGYVLLKQGYDVKVSEVHGMSQRGGSVVTYVRYGEKVYSKARGRLLLFQPEHSRFPLKYQEAFQSPSHSSDTQTSGYSRLRDVLTFPVSLLHKLCIFL